MNYYKGGKLIMCSKAKHAQRSHRTYKRRMYAARWYCNYNMTREQRQAMKLYWQLRMGGGKAVTEDK